MRRTPDATAAAPAAAPGRCLGELRQPVVEHRQCASQEHAPGQLEQVVVGQAPVDIGGGYRIEQGHRLAQPLDQLGDGTAAQCAGGDQGLRIEQSGLAHAGDRRSRRVDRQPGVDARVHECRFGIEQRLHQCSGIEAAGRRRAARQRLECRAAHRGCDRGAVRRPSRTAGRGG